MLLANLVSLLRAAAMPVIITLLVLDTHATLLWALIVFLVAVISDYFDGYIARKLKSNSAVGSFLDPFADRILIAGILLYLAILGEFHYVFIGIFILRDLITGMTFLLASREDIRIKRKNIYGKLFVNSLYFIILGYLLEPFSIIGGFITLIATPLALLFAISSIIYYSTIYIKASRTRVTQGTPIKNEDLVILANKRSRGFKDRYRRRLLKRFAKRRGAPIIYFPNSKDMYKGIEKKYKKKKHIIIAGGDGSFESALNYKPLQKKVLGFFPLGAGNVYYSYFYKGKRFEYLRSRFPFHKVKLDVLELEWQGGKRQTGFTSIGIDADVIRLSHAKTKRTRHGFLDYVRASIRAAGKGKADYDFTLHVGKKKIILHNSSLINFFKAPFIGYGLRGSVGHTKPADGNVYCNAIVNTHSSILNKPLRVWAFLLGILNMNKLPFVFFKGNTFTVKSDVPFPIQAGGEFLGYSQWLKVKVKRKQDVLMV